jgi:PAS domain-containing protein
MENSDIFNQLPDAVCIIDSVGNVQRCNLQFQKIILKSAASVNFINDVLHSQHEEKIGLTMENLPTEGTAENHGFRALGVLSTLTMSERSQQCKFRNEIHIIRL